MPLKHVLEVATSLLATYGSSEFLYGSRKRASMAGVAVLVVQTTSTVASWRFPAFIVLQSGTIAGPMKVIFVCVAFTGTLYLDIVHRRGGRLPYGVFAREIGKELLLLLPICPWVSVFISCSYSSSSCASSTLLGCRPSC